MGEGRTFAHGFRGQALPRARVSEQIDDKPVTLAGDEVIKLPRRAGSVRLDECPEDLLVLGGDHELLKRLVVPLELFDTLDHELHCNPCVRLARVWIYVGLPR